MPVRFGLSMRQTNLSIEECQEYWAGRHAELFVGVPGLVSYVQNHALLKNGEPILGHPKFDICAEVEFSSDMDMKSATESEYYSYYIYPDENHLLKAKGRRFMLTEREIVHLGKVGLTEGFKVITYPGEGVSSRTSLYQTHPNAVRHLRYLVRGGDELDSCRRHAIDQQWFANQEDALRFSQDVPYDPVASDSFRVIVRERVVVPRPFDSYHRDVASKPDPHAV